MAQPFPTEPLRPDDERTRRVERPHGCRAGHDQPHNPTWHPTLGLVPALTSVILGALLLAAVLGLELWQWPGAIPWTIGVAVVGLVVSGCAQFLLGHRGTCWLRRTLRWWLGPAGNLIDPVEAG